MDEGVGWTDHREGVGWLGQGNNPTSYTLPNQEDHRKDYRRMDSWLV